jgi:hypothetical protein
MMLRSTRPAPGTAPRPKPRARGVAAPIAAALLLLVPPSRATTQTPTPVLECVRPARTGGVCRVEVLQGPVRETIVVRVRDRAGNAVGGHPVEFDGFGQLGPNPTTDANGVASAEFSAAGITAPVTLTVRTTVGGQRITDSIVVAPMRTPPSAARILGGNTSVPAWYVERQLARPIVVPLDPTDPLACAATRVRFRALTEGSGAAPDTAAGQWVSTEIRGVPYGRCVASARWRLGKEAGEHVLQAEVVGAPAQRVQFAATARALPRLMAGIAVSVAERYHRVKDSSRVVRLTRTEPPLQQQYDSAVAIRRAERSERLPVFPVLGIDFAPYLPWKRFRLLGGVNPLDARDQAVLGASLLQGAFGGSRESVPIDFHLFMHLQRRTEAVDAATCVSVVAAACPTRERSIRPVGVGVMVAVDGLSLLGNLLAAFPLP